LEISLPFEIFSWFKKVSLENFGTVSAIAEYQIARHFLNEKILPLAIINGISQVPSKIFFILSLRKYCIEKKQMFITLLKTC